MGILDSLGLQLEGGEEPAREEKRLTGTAVLMPWNPNVLQIEDSESKTLNYFFAAAEAGLR